MKVRLGAWLDQRDVMTLWLLIVLAPLLVFLPLAVLLGALFGPDMASVPLWLWTMWVIFSCAALGR